MELASEMFGGRYFVPDRRFAVYRSGREYFPKFMAVTPMGIDGDRLSRMID